MIKKLHDYSLFGLFLSIILLLGKHFWPSFSYVDGVRLDYLSPTLYVSDLVIVGFITLSIIRYYKSFLQIVKKAPLPLILFTFLLICSSLLAQNKAAAVFGALKLIEFSLLSLTLAVSFKKNQLKLVIYSLSTSVIIAAVLMTLQLFQQRSINGPFYYLGERSYTESTIAVAKFSLNGNTFVRPYATFPHPNVLAFFLLFSGVILSSSFSFYRKRNKIILIPTIITFILLPFTFARFVTIILFFYIAYIFRMFKAKTPAWIVLASLFFGFIVFYNSRFINFQILFELTTRLSLINISTDILKENALFGVGLNNFFYHEAVLQKKFSPVFLQPVHNIYLYLFTQLGVLSGFLVGVFVIKTFFRAKNTMNSVKGILAKNFYTSCFVLFLAVLLVGFLDHFFLTLQQGQMMLSIILGFCWNKNLS